MDLWSIMWKFWWFILKYAKTTHIMVNLYTVGYQFWNSPIFYTYLFQLNCIITFSICQKNTWNYFMAFCSNSSFFFQSFLSVDRWLFWVPLFFGQQTAPFNEWVAEIGPSLCLKKRQMCIINGFPYPIRQSNRQKHWHFPKTTRKTKSYSDFLNSNVHE